MCMHAHAHECRCPPRPEDTLELESQDVVSHLILMLGAKLGSSERAVCPLNHSPISLILELQFYGMMEPPFLTSKLGDMLLDPSSSLCWLFDTSFKGWVGNRHSQMNPCMVMVRGFQFSYFLFHLVCLKQYLGKSPSVF